MDRGDRDLDAFLAVVDRLDRGQLLALTAAGSPEHASELLIARPMARRAAKRARRLGDLDRIREQIVAWASVGGAGSAVWAPVGMPGDLLLEDVRRAAVPALVDAASAVVLGRALDPWSRRVLLQRWQEVVGTAPHL